MLFFEQICDTFSWVKWKYHANDLIWEMFINSVHKWYKDINRLSDLITDRFSMILQEIESKNKIGIFEWEINSWFLRTVFDALQLIWVVENFSSKKYEIIFFKSSIRGQLTNFNELQ